MPDLDAALNRENALSVGRRIAGHHAAHIGHDRLGDIAAPVDTGVVKVFFIRATDEIAHVGDGSIGNDRHRLQCSDRSEIARLTAEVLQDLGFGREAKSTI